MLVISYSSPKTLAVAIGLISMFLCLVVGAWSRLVAVFVSALDGRAWVALRRDSVGAAWLTVLWIQGVSSPGGQIPGGASGSFE